jgi:hypothetical protein
VRVQRELLPVNRSNKCGQRWRNPKMVLYGIKYLDAYIAARVSMLKGEA